jgi:anthranilate synthase/aminodeoxychorismate synthase-like glutamine amidotransferase
MILIIDNYDSFVFNIARYCQELGAETELRRNDFGTLKDIEALGPDQIILSPGPCGPQEAGLSLDIIKHFSGKVPILGICLGHQCIGEAFGGTVGRAKRPMHGLSSLIRHDGQGLFSGMPARLTVGRYHSLVVNLSDQSASPLKVTAWSEEDEIMGLEHVDHPTFGIQFHPESILTESGHHFLKNFLSLNNRI